MCTCRLFTRFRWGLVTARSAWRGALLLGRCKGAVNYKIVFLISCSISAVKSNRFVVYCVCRLNQCHSVLRTESRSNGETQWLIQSTRPPTVPPSQSHPRVRPLAWFRGNSNACYSCTSIRIMRAVWCLAAVVVPQMCFTIRWKASRNSSKSPRRGSVCLHSYSRQVPLLKQMKYLARISFINT